ncbi:hypothetical protein LINPERPRIM_LOCUS4980 [Linum perenne]
MHLPNPIAAVSQPQPCSNSHRRFPLAIPSSELRRRHTQLGAAPTPHVDGSSSHNGLGTASLGTQISSPLLKISQDVVGAMAREENDTRSNSSFESVGVEGTKGKRSGEGSSNSSKRSKKDQVGDSLMMVANTLQSYYESKKKKEESRHSTKEIYEVLCNIPGLSRTEIATVIKYNNSGPGQFNLLLDIPCEERKLFVECFLNES